MFTLNSNGELSRDGAVLGPVFDSIANHKLTKPADLSGIQQAFYDLLDASAKALARVVEDARKLAEDASAQATKATTNARALAKESQAHAAVAVKTAQDAQEELATYRKFVESALGKIGEVLGDDKMAEGHRFAVLKDLHAHAATPAREREIAAIEAQQAVLASRKAQLVAGK